MKCTFLYIDRDSFVVENVKEIEYRENNRDATCITRDERRARVPGGWYDVTIDPDDNDPEPTPVALEANIAPAEAHITDPPAEEAAPEEEQPFPDDTPASDEPAGASEGAEPA